MTNLKREENASLVVIRLIVDIGKMYWVQHIILCEKDSVFGFQ